MRAQRIPDSELALDELAEVRVSVAALRGVFNDETNTGARQLTRIADLTTGLRVERRAVENDLALFACAERLHLRAALQQRDDDTFAVGAFVTLEGRLGIDGRPAAQVDLELAGRTSAIALRFHFGFEAVLIDGEVALARRRRR